MNPRLEAAISYVRRGWAVLPLHTSLAEGCSCRKPDCPSPGKHPRVLHGVKDSSTDEAVIQRWWSMWPEANVGIATGARSGLVVLDIDPRNGGDYELNELEQAFGKLPETIESLTGGGGRHIFFEHPGSPVKNLSGRSAIRPGVEIKGDEGYVVAPPSLHTSGKHYRWEVSSEPGEVHIALLPPWLEARIQIPAESPSQGSALPNLIPEGSRNETLTSLAGTMRRKGMEETAIFAGLMETNRSQCSPPLGEDEVRNIAKSICRYPQGEGKAPESPKQGWDEPIPLDASQKVLPAYPLESLSPWVADFVRAISIQRQVPTDLPAILGLCVVATSVQKAFKIEVKEGYSEALNLYGLVTLGSGERKSPVFKDMVRPLEEFEKTFAKDKALEIAEIQTRIEIQKNAFEAAKKAAARVKPSEREPLEHDAVGMAKVLSNMSILSLPRILSDDVTPEQIANLMAEQNGRLALMSAEGTVFEIMAGRYSKDGAPNFEVFLKAHSGDQIRVDRRGSPPIFVNEPALTMAITVQPDVTQGLLRKQGFRGRGLLARWMYSQPRSIVGYRDVNSPAASQEVRDRYHSNLTRLLDRAFRGNWPKPPEPKLLRLDTAALDLFNSFSAEVEVQLREHGVLTLLRDWGGKLPGLTARIAGGLHLADLVQHHAPWEKPVPVETLQRAINIGRYLIPHAQAALLQMGDDPNIEGARYIMGWAKSRHMEAVSRRDLWRGVSHQFKNQEELDAALEILEEYEIARRMPIEGKEGPGRKASPRILFNPAILKSNDRIDVIDKIGPHHEPEGNSVNSVEFVIEGAKPDSDWAGEDPGLGQHQKSEEGP
jgi:replicative DNA helicase